jgi:hypothetical protein
MANAVLTYFAMFFVKLCCERTPFLRFNPGTQAEGTYDFLWAGFNLKFEISHLPNFPPHGRGGVGAGLDGHQ